MSAPLRVCLLAAELTPLAKTGGLGDVTAALAQHLGGAGHDVRTFLPAYADIPDLDGSFLPVDFARGIPIAMGGRTLAFDLLTGLLPGSRLPIYLVDCPRLFRREGIYSSEGDEHLRFAFFTRAVLECCQRMGWAPQILHCNDWHTALGPLYLKTLYSWDDLFGGTRSVLTIHNIGYQGMFPSGVVEELGLRGHEELLHQDDLRLGRLGFLTSGILHADVLTTVSPTHAREIQTAEYGMGLEDLLRRRRRDLVGILNGVDYSVWDPRHDPFISFHFTPEDLEGKRKNKQVLLEGLSLDYGERVPALGLVSRLVYQKGIDLLLDPLPRFLEHRDLRLVVLGSGEGRYENYFRWLQIRFPEKVCYYKGFNNELAHLIEAGSDMFLMPSLYEPCGLNQMYSLRYGTVPIVRRTGGLADTVEPFDPGTGDGTGFLFDHASRDGVTWATDLALGVYRDTGAWRRLMLNGMARDFSWERQGSEYVELYRRLLA